MAETQTTDLERVIQARDFVALHEMLKHWSPGTAAGLIEPLPIEQQVVAFRLLPRDLAAEVFEYLSLEAQQRGEGHGQRRGGERPERHGAGRSDGAAR